MIAARMSPVPGATHLVSADADPALTYRTWPMQDGGCGWECLLCGEWGAEESPAAAGRRRSGHHASWCHVTIGCHCGQPHVTAAQAARLGIGGEYPERLAAVLLLLAGGTRVTRPPIRDKNGTLFGMPRSKSWAALVNEATARYIVSRLQMPPRSGAERQMTLFEEAA